MADLPTSLRDGRYAVVRLLGEGGQGATFEAVDKKDGRLVAVKRFRVRGARSWKEVELAEREAHVLASLSHPALPRYVEHFEENGELFLVTEKIEGESLADLRKAGKSLDEASVLRLLREASAALDYLHGRVPPIIHRDLKPSNVILRPDGSFAFIDFGAVRDRMKPEGGSTVVGTFGYMAPEQFQGRAMPASDVYAIAATALVLLTGREPEDLPHVGLAIDVKTALGGKKAGRGLTRALEAMLDPNPDSRPARIGPLLADLGRAWEQGFAEETSRAQRKGSRRRERHEERARRRAERWERRARRGGPWLPWPLRLVLNLALTAAEISVTLALRVAVPIVLTLLSVVFGKGMREAAGQVSAGGKAGAEAIRRARDLLESGTDEASATPPGAEGARSRGPRIDEDEVRRAGGRVAQPAEVDEDEDEDEDAEAEAEAEARAAEERRARRGRG
jgi:hypothetical protein